MSKTKLSGKLRLGKKVAEWSGNPTNCDICGGLLGTSFIDGKTKFGPWGIMCPSCHTTYGVGLGTGQGQKYSRPSVAMTRWVKVGG